MELFGSMDSVWHIIEPLLPVLITVVIAVAVLWGADRLLVSNLNASSRHRSTRQLVMILLTVCAALAAVLSLPITDELRVELLGLLGIVITGLIAFSSTTFVANMMAGLMLRSIRSFNPGDFIEAGEFFGRVTERALFHTEIQSEDRDLVTLPNLFLATNPVKVVRSSGTAINCTLSLGYDVPHREIVEVLKGAAEACDLEEPFVQVLELGDYAVTYKATGFYPEIKHLLSKRSQFKAAILDALHGAGIEIVSPTFMNQRILDGERKVIAVPEGDNGDSPADIFPEAVLFDKADRASRIQMLEEKRKLLKEQLKSLKSESGGEAEGGIKRVESQIQTSETLLERELAREEND